MDAADQLGHLAEHAVHLGHDVHAVHVQAVGDRPAQCGVQGRTAFRGVDQLAVEQRLDGFLQLGLAGQAHQQLAGLRGDQVLRVVEEQAAGAQREVLETPGIGAEGIAHAEALHRPAVLGQGLPGGQLGGVEGVLVVRHGLRIPFRQKQAFE
ncbi:hypothetical protein D9M69_375860 [compost metagenome]